MKPTLRHRIACRLDLWAKRLTPEASLRERLLFIQAAEFPEGALKRVALAFPSFSAEELLLCEKGFRQYASACALEGPGSGVAMPSKAVDELWHQLMLHTRFYEEFCARAFGEFLHHEPGPLGATPRCAKPALAPCVDIKGASTEEDALGRAWRGACKAEGMSESETGLPLLFQADALLQTPEGFMYSEDDQRSAVAVAQLKEWASRLETPIKT